MELHIVGICDFTQTIPFVLSIVPQYDAAVKRGYQQTYNGARRIISNTQFERKAVKIHMAMVKDQVFGKTVRKSYA